MINTKGKYRIEKGIPIPFRAKSGRWMELAKPMQIGDSILVDSFPERAALISAMHRLGYTATSRKIGTTFRVWRVNQPAPLLPKEPK